MLLKDEFISLKYNKTFVNKNTCSLLLFIIIHYLLPVTVNPAIP